LASNAALTPGEWRQLRTQPPQGALPSSARGLGPGRRGAAAPQSRWRHVQPPGRAGLEAPRWKQPSPYGAGPTPGDDRCAVPSPRRGLCRSQPGASAPGDAGLPRRHQAGTTSSPRGSRGAGSPAL